VSEWSAPRVEEGQSFDNPVGWDHFDGDTWIRFEPNPAFKREWVGWLGERVDWDEDDE
jgi:hypothetical protein